MGTMNIFLFLHCIFGALSIATSLCDPRIEKCIEYVAQPQPDWNAAERYCETLHPNGVLAAINKQIEEEIIKGPLGFINYDPYLGGRKFGNNFQWVDGSCFSYTNWCTASEQPAINGNCIQVYRNDTDGCTAGQWKAVSCSLNTTFYCEYGNFSVSSCSTPTTNPTPTTSVQWPHICVDATQTRCFALVPIAVPWSDGYCQASFPNGNLASIRSAFEQSAAAFLMSSAQPLPGQGDAWIGGRVMNGQLQWSDSYPYTDKVSYDKWCAGQYPPTNATGTGCVKILKQQEGSCWKITDCKESNSVLCEYENPSGSTPSSNCSARTDCYDLMRCYGITTSGVQTIEIDGIAPFQVYCDMETDGGGWTVFQRRIDNSQMFETQIWDTYRVGFNNGMDRNSWIGLDHIHALTAKDSGQVHIRMDFYGDRNPVNCPGTYLKQCLPRERWYAKWQGFAVGTFDDRYTLTVGSMLEGNISLSEAFTLNSGMKFTTVDQDNDYYIGSCGGGNCASCTCGGGWWYYSGSNFCGSGTDKFNGNYDRLDNNGCFSFYQVSTAQDGTHYFWRIPITSELKLRRAR